MRKNKIEMDYAREIYNKICNDDEEPYIDYNKEKELIKVVRKAEKLL